MDIHDHSSDDEEDVVDANMAWPWTRLVLRCFVYHSKEHFSSKRKAAADLVLVEWDTPECAFTWEESSGFAESLNKVEDGKLHYCIITASNDEEDGTSVPEGYWDYPGLFPFKTKQPGEEDGAVVQVSDWDGQFSPQELQQMVKTYISSQQKEADLLQHHGAVGGEPLAEGDNQEQQQVQHEQSQKVQQREEAGEAMEIVSSDNDEEDPLGNSLLPQNHLLGLGDVERALQAQADVLRDRLLLLKQKCETTLQTYAERRQNTHVRGEPFSYALQLHLEPSEQDLLQLPPQSFESIKIVGFISYSCCQDSSTRHLGSISVPWSTFSNSQLLQHWVVKFPNISSVFSRHLSESDTVNSTKRRKVEASVSLPAPSQEQQLAPKIVIQPGLRKASLQTQVNFALFTSFVIFHYKERHHAKTVSKVCHYDLALSRIQSCLAKTSPILATGPICPFLKFTTQGASIVPSSSRNQTSLEVPITWICFDWDTIQQHGFLKFQGVLIQMVKLVQANALFVGKRLSANLKHTLLDPFVQSKSAALTPKRPSSLFGFLTAPGDRGQEGALAGLGTVRDYTQSLLMFFRYLVNPSGNSFPMIVVEQLMGVLQNVNAFALCQLKVFGTIEEQMRMALVSVHEETIVQFSLRIKAVLNDSTPPLCELVQYLFHGWQLDQLIPGATKELQARLNYLFGSGAVSQLLVKQLTGHLICGLLHCCGGFRAQVFQDLVLICPQLNSLKTFNISLLGSFLTSAIIVTEGIPYLLVVNDKVARSHDISQYPLPKQVFLSVVLLYLWRSYVLQLPNVQVEPLFLKRKERHEAFKQHLQEQSQSELKSLFFPLHLSCSNVSQQTGPSSVKFVFSLAKKEAAFQAFKHVYQFGFSSYFLESSWRGTTHLESEPLASPSLNNPSLYIDNQSTIAVLSPICSSFQQIRVTLTNSHLLLLKDNQELYRNVVTLVRHSHEISSKVYAPASNMLRIEATMKQLGEYQGLGEHDWIPSSSNMSSYKPLLKSPILPVSDQSIFAAASLFNFACLNEFPTVVGNKSADAQILPQITLASHKMFYHNQFYKWLAGDFQIDTLGQQTKQPPALLNFPSYLTLASIPCLLESDLAFIPVCSCCKFATKIYSPTAQLPEVHFYLRTLGCISEHSFEYPWIFQSESFCKVLFCPKIFECMKSKVDLTNGDTLCSCKDNIAFVLAASQLYPSSLPFTLIEQLKSHLFK